MSTMFSYHDRNCFIVIGFANRLSDGSKWRQSLEQNFDVFIDVSQVKDPLQVMAVIKQYDVDILFNLNGWTNGGRHDIFAMRCAPI